MPKRVDFLPRYFEVKLTALKYTKRGDFQLNHAKLFSWARYHGVLGELCEHMTAKSKIDYKVRYAEAKEAALKYTRRNHFYKNDMKHFSWAKRNNLLKEFCSHMDVGWTKEKVLVEAKKYNKRNTFSNQSRGAYLAAYRNGWLDEACSHMGNLYKNSCIVRNFDASKAIGLALSCEKLTDFQHQYSSAYYGLLQAGLYQNVKLMHQSLHQRNGL